MEANAKMEQLWKVMQRYDQYINATNTKATIILTFNSLIISGLLLKWSDLITMYKPIPCFVIISAFFLITIAFASLYSLFYAFKVVNPYLVSPLKPQEYHSKIYFGHVSMFETGEDFAKSIDKSDAECFFTDLCYQVHILAKGITQKYERLKKSFQIIEYCMIPALFILLILKIIIDINALSTK